ncbi:MAG: fluoride efflux transporter CrcB [Muribaculaceae bacterium]|nr:fluoride efflux transporter CrcB [Muribaculaceae bacterium]
MKEVLYVGAGGFLGSVMRYLVSVAIKHSDSGFPWGTFIVNIVGCFAIGILGGLINRNPNISTEMGLFLTVGICGGFTTFSTFSKESLLLLQSGNYLGLSGYIIGSVLIGILAVWLGFSLMK